MEWCECECGCVCGGSMGMGVCLVTVVLDVCEVCDWCGVRQLT